MIYEIICYKNMKIEKSYKVRGFVNAHNVANKLIKNGFIVFVDKQKA